ncbi:MAG: AI-2E family transporter [Clostridiales bacterium]|nr:AI-2E family transporter [Candidatus Cacconaster stercorequi]
MKKIQKESKRENIYVKWGITLFITVCAVLIFYDTFHNSGVGSTLQRFSSKLIGTLAPVLYGLAIAYLLTPVMKWFERLIRSGMEQLKEKRGKEIREKRGWVRGVSILLTELVAFFAVYLLMAILIPQLADSVSMLIDNAESYYSKIYNWANGLLDTNTKLGAWIQKMVNNYYSDALNLLREKILPWAQDWLGDLTGGIWNGIWSVLIFAKNLIVGIIISIYLLAMKEKSLARCSKLLYGLLKETQARWVIRGARRTNAIFSGFVRGKLLDSVIIGVLCFIGCTVLNLPYTPLISVVVGVTNIIPFFGPFLGAIPSAFLILLVSPIKCLYFIIFVLLLQQLDGNVIGPKILGDSTGISSFWVVVAILVGGGFGGVLGMFLGVPIFACLQALVKFLIDRRLMGRNMPLQAYEYVNRDREEDPPMEVMKDEPPE